MNPQRRDPQRSPLSQARHSERLARLRLASTMTLTEVLAALHKRKFLITALAALLAGLAMLAVAQLPRRYTAEGLLMIETRQLTIPELQSAVSNLMLDPALARSETWVLTSRALADRVARRLDLASLPEFNPTLRDPDDAPFARLNPLRWLPEAWRDRLEALGLPMPETRPPQMEPEAAWQEVVDAVRGGLAVRNDERSYALAVSFQGLEPERNAAIVNAVMEEYIADQVAARSQGTTSANQWLIRRAEELRREVEAADRAVQDLRASLPLIRTRDGTGTAQQLNELTTQLGQARAERLQAEANYQRALEVARNPRGATVSDVTGSPMMQVLREKEAQLVQRDAELAVRLGARHPERAALDSELARLRRQIAVEGDKLVRSLDSVVQVARAREAALEQQVGAQRTQAGDVARAEVMLAQAEKQAEAKRELYQTFMVRSEQTAQSSGVRPADARIVSTAVPPLYPSAPRVRLYGAVAVLGSLMAAAGLALLLEWRTDRFETLDEVSHVTGLHGLGALPRFRGRRRANRRLVGSVLDQPDSAVSETLRGIRVNLRNGLGGNGCRQPPKVVLVTSALAEEGKTTFAAALGQRSALDGQRALVLDCDLRRPALGRLLDTAGSGPGLDDLLAGQCSWSEALVCDPRSGLHILPARGGMTNPQRLLESEAFRACLRWATDRYDLIILDSPPVMRVADAVVLTRWADAVIFVISWRQTRRRVVVEALWRLEGAGRAVTGAVLSRMGGTVPAEYMYGGYGAARSSDAGDAAASGRG